MFHPTGFENRPSGARPIVDTFFQLTKRKKKESWRRSDPIRDSIERREPGWGGVRKGMDTFLSVPAHFTGSPLISPRSRIDPWLHRRLTEITKGKKRRGRGRRIKDWPLGYYCTKKREEGTARYSGPRADEDTVARVTRLNLRSYNSNWHPNRVPRDERISILFSARAEGSPILPSFLPSFFPFERDRSEQRGGCARLPSFSGDERHAGIDPRRAYHARL